MIMFSFRISSAVEQWTVNPLVVSSNLTSGEVSTMNYTTTPGDFD